MAIWCQGQNLVIWFSPCLLLLLHPAVVFFFFFFLTWPLEASLLTYLVESSLVSLYLHVEIPSVWFSELDRLSKALGKCLREWKEGGSWLSRGTSSRILKVSDYAASKVSWETERELADVISIMIWGCLIWYDRYDCHGGVWFLGLPFILCYFLVITDSSLFCISRLMQ